MVGIGGLLGVRVFGWKGVGNLGIGKVDLLWTPGRRPADLFGHLAELVGGYVWVLGVEIGLGLAGLMAWVEG